MDEITLQILAESAFTNEMQDIFQKLLKGEGVQSKDIKSLKTHAFEMKR